MAGDRHAADVARGVARRVLQELPQSEGSESRGVRPIARDRVMVLREVRLSRGAEFSGCHVKRW
jgi:hypothetical protein